MSFLQLNRLLFLIALMTTIGGCGFTTSSDGYPTGSEIRASGETIREHMNVLASDAMSGRGIGTEGFESSAAYVAQQFDEIGMEPLGDDGTFFQSIEFISTQPNLTDVTLSIEREGVSYPFEFPDDFAIWGSFDSPESNVRAPLVFVGYGIQAPLYDHDDFSGVDVRGKVLVTLSGAPPHFSADQQAYYSSARVKLETATNLGAVGRINIRTEEQREHRPWTGTLEWLTIPELRWLAPEGQQYPNVPSSVAIDASLSPSGMTQLFSLAGYEPEEVFAAYQGGTLGSFDLGLSVRSTYRSVQDRVRSMNVVGILRGSDEDLANEYLVYTAHLDHLGTSDTGEIFNGAYDNAAGVGTIIEVARRIATSGIQPRRSIIFAAVTAEESGLLGSDFFVHHPPVAIEQIVANINIDMPYYGVGMRDVLAIGSTHSSLEQSVELAADYMGFDVQPDLSPELVRFIRSDQYSFVRRGIPAISIKPGSTASDSDIDGEQLTANYWENHYHQSSDSLNLPFDANTAGRFGLTTYYLGLLIANERQRPTWNEGDFFGDEFGGDH